MLPAIQIDSILPPISKGPQLQHALRAARYRLPGALVGLWQTAEWQVLEQAYDLLDTYVSYIELWGLDSIHQQIPIHCPRHDLYWLYMLQGRMAIASRSKHLAAQNGQWNIREGHYRISYLPAGAYLVEIPPGQHRLFYLVHKPQMLFREPSDELYPDLPPIQAARIRGDAPHDGQILSMKDGALNLINQYLRSAGRTYLQRQLRINQLTYDLISVAQQSLDRQQLRFQANRSWATRIQELIQDSIQHGAPMDMHDLALRLGISVSYLRNVFRSVTGQPIGRYITESKLQYSRELLSTGLSPTQAAFYLNWHPAHFSAAFRDRYGESPTEYIQRIEKDI